MYKKVIFLVVFIFTHMLLSAQKADDILGNWQSEKKDKIISIYKVDDLYYGKVIWIKDSALGTAKDRLDINNPNANLKKRKVNTVS